MLLYVAGAICALVLGAAIILYARVSLVGLVVLIIVTAFTFLQPDIWGELTGKATSCGLKTKDIVTATRDIRLVRVILSYEASLTPISRSERCDRALCSAVHVKSADKEGKNDRKGTNFDG